MGKIGIYGGTFNPPHCGHISAAGQALERLKLDRLLVLPASIPPHKVLPPNSPTATQRLELTKLAMATLPQAEVLDLELCRSGTSYTADTIGLLRSQYPGEQLYLLMGTDMFLSFHTWYQPEIICRSATLVVMLRDEKDRNLGEQLREQKERIQNELQGEVIFLNNDILPVSSTDVRRMTSLGALEGLVPPGVAEKIRAWELYGTEGDLKGLSLERLEDAVVCLLDPKRVNHVLGCRDTAVQLAEKYGADVTDAARAALLHDITKALNPDLQLKFCQAHRVPREVYQNDSRSTFHATTGAIAAREVFGENQAVCDAIACHTTGKGHMSKLDLIIYIADYIEPNRDFPGVEKLRELADLSLERAVLTGIEMTLEQLRRQGRRITDNSYNAVVWLRQVLEV